jgi:hypothetical protein
MASAYARARRQHTHHTYDTYSHLYMSACMEQVLLAIHVYPYICISQFQLLRL